MEKLSVKKVKASLVPPSEKTPTGLYSLSTLDQTFPFLIQAIFAYYNNNSNNVVVSNVDRMKMALGKVLVPYYPLAGQLIRGWDGKLTVRCTGEGVSFVEATSDADMAILGDVGVADPSKFRNLVCFDQKSATDIVEIPCLAIQVTRFKCGGFVVGVSFNHTVMDGISLTNFINSWAQIARGVPLSLPPFIDRSSLCHRQPLKVEFPHEEFIKINDKNRQIPAAANKEQTRVTRSFCFTAKKLNQLRYMVANDVDNQFDGTPTRFELISALLWVNWTKAFKIHPSKTTQAIIVVDSRRKLKLPLQYFGNCICCVPARSTAGELTQRPLAFAVKRVREAIADVTEERMRSAIDYYEATRQGYEYMNTVWITKWSRLAFHEADFGWGQPGQMAPPMLPDSLVVTLSRMDSDDLILSLSLPASVMEAFQLLMSKADIPSS